MFLLKVSKHRRYFVNFVAMCLFQSLLFAVSGVLAFLIRFEFSLPARDLVYLAFAAPIWIVVKGVVFHILALDRGGWRYVSVPDIVRLAIGNVSGSVSALIVIMFLAPGGFPRSIYVMDLLVCSLITAGVRLAARLLLNSHDQLATEKKKIVIYGAGNAGVTLLSEIRSNPRLGYDVRGFIDDDTQKAGQLIQGVPVLGTGAELTAIAAKRQLEEVLIAMSSASGSRMTSVLRSCHDAGLRCRTIPSLTEIMENRALTPQIRDVAVEDLLGRAPVHLDEDAIRERLGDQVVLVTGAAGSIGSELCRQIARFGPGKIIGYDIAETPLFETDRELRKIFPKLEFRPEIGSIQNRSRLDEVIRRYRPSVIYHAAAYKHVPLMEDMNAWEAMRNNALGTWRVARCAVESGVEKLVLVSTDKAVNPTNVMGASKRLAELLCQSLAAERTRIVMVRFGNVLGSTGSVIPKFREQIERGGPVTVTHPEITRYFMSIPEAAQLVLQAGLMGQGGEIFVLDMGEPVKIVDLARDMIRLSGLRDDGIQIAFTGLRRGEKLYEELLADNEHTLATRHPKVRVLRALSPPDPAWVRETLAWLEAPQALEDDAVRTKLASLVPEYRPPAGR